MGRPKKYGKDKVVCPNRDNPDHPWYSKVYRKYVRVYGRADYGEKPKAKWVGIGWICDNCGHEWNDSDWKDSIKEGITIASKRN